MKHRLSLSAARTLPLLALTLLTPACSGASIPDSWLLRESRAAQNVGGPRRVPMLNPQTPRAVEQEARRTPHAAAETSPYDSYTETGEPAPQAESAEPQGWGDRLTSWLPDISTPETSVPTAEAAPPPTPSPALSYAPPPERKPISGNPPLALAATGAQAEQQIAMGERAPGEAYPELTDTPPTPARFREIQAERPAREEMLIEQRTRAEEERQELKEEPSDLPPPVMPAEPAPASEPPQGMHQEPPADIAADLPPPVEPAVEEEERPSFWSRLVSRGESAEPVESGTGPMVDAEIMQTPPPLPAPVRKEAAAPAEPLMANEAPILPEPALSDPVPSVAEQSEPEPVLAAQEEQNEPEEPAPAAPLLAETQEEEPEDTDSAAIEPPPAMEEVPVAQALEPHETATAEPEARALPVSLLPEVRAHPRQLPPSRYQARRITH